MEASARRDGAIIICLMLIAALARWHTLGGDYYGDEAWYVYLARTWGADAGAITGGPDPRPHLLYRPVFYAIYHLAASVGLTTARVFTCAIGVAVVPLSIRLAERFGAARSYSYAAGVVVALHPNLIRFNAVAFPDTLAGAFLVLAALAFVDRRRLQAPLFLLLAVLSKESTIPYAIAFTALAAWRGERRRQAALFLLPCFYVAAVVLITTQVMGAPSQGWAWEPLTTLFFRHLVAAPIMVPFMFALLASRRWEPLVLWATAPLFYMFWCWGLGKGVAVWYAVAPAPLASAALAAGIDAGGRYAKTAIASYVARHKRLASGLAFVGVCALAPALWREIRANYRTLDASRHPNVLTTAAAIIEKRRPRTIAFINCHFAYAYEPLRTPESRATLVNAAALAEAPSDVDLSVWCNHEKSLRAPDTFAGCTLLRDPEIAIFSREGCD